MHRTPHHLRSTFNALDTFGFVSSDGFYSIGSASGPVSPMFDDLGELTLGTELKLAYNYATEEYAIQAGGWKCTVQRINRKSITVVADGQPYRIKL